jgi:hypothetical protein
MKLQVEPLGQVTLPEQLPPTLHMKVHVCPIPHATLTPWQAPPLLHT